MKIKAKSNGNILELLDEEADALVATGLYEPIDGESKPKRSAAKTAESDASKAPPPAEPTKVAPLTTADLPKKKGK